MDGNAVTWFLDRHLAEGRGDAPVFTDPHRGFTYAAQSDQRDPPATRAASIPP